jgi:hypothetical protein
MKLLGSPKWRKDVFQSVSRLAMVRKHQTSDNSIPAWWDSNIACVARTKYLFSIVRIKKQASYMRLPE